MYDEKYDFKCIYFTNQIINQLSEEGYFLQNLINPETLRYILLKLVQNNLDSVGVMDLSKEQMEKALDKSFQITFKDNLEDMVKEGLIVYDGIDDDGEYTVHLTDAGEESIKKSKPLRKKIRQAIEEAQKEKEKGSE